MINGKMEDIVQLQQLSKLQWLFIMVIQLVKFLEVMQVQLILVKHLMQYQKLSCISKEKSQKSICFVTGVPGAGKTLVGLNIATTHIDKNNDLYSVFLSGNGPLVAILREALARDKVRHEKKRSE